MYVFFRSKSPVCQQSPITTSLGGTPSLLCPSSIVSPFYFTEALALHARLLLLPHLGSNKTHQPASTALSIWIPSFFCSGSKHPVPDHYHPSTPCIQTFSLPCLASIICILLLKSLYLHQGHGNILSLISSRNLIFVLLLC